MHADGPTIEKALRCIIAKRALRGFKSFDSRAFCAVLRKTDLFSSHEAFDMLATSELVDLFYCYRSILTSCYRRAVRTQYRPLAV